MINHYFKTTMKFAFTLCSLIAFQCFGEDVLKLDHASENQTARMDKEERQEMEWMTLNGVFPMVPAFGVSALHTYAFSMDSNGVFRLESELVNERGIRSLPKTVITGNVMYDTQPLEITWANLSPPNGISEITGGASREFHFSFPRKDDHLFHTVHTNEVPMMTLALNALPFGEPIIGSLNIWMEGHDERKARLERLAVENEPKHSHRIETQHTRSLKDLLFENNIQLEAPDVVFTHVVSAQCHHFSDFMMLSGISSDVQAPFSSLVIPMPGEFHFSGKDYRADATLFMHSQMNSADREARIIVADEEDSTPPFAIVIRSTAFLNVTEKGDFATILGLRVEEMKDTLYLSCPLNHDFSDIAR